MYCVCKGLEVKIFREDSPVQKMGSRLDIYTKYFGIFLYLKRNIQDQINAVGIYNKSLCREYVAYQSNSKLSAPTTSSFYIFWWKLTTEITLLNVILSGNLQP